MITVIEENWNKILDRMKEENDISPVAFTTWVKPLRPLGLTGNVLNVMVDKENILLPSNYFDKKYRMPLIMAIAEVLEVEYDVRFILPDDIVEEKTEIKAPPKIDRNVLESNLNPRYTFDTFVVGKNNELAHATALIVAEDPGVYGNPLFIYGGVGLGKTHLMHAIANYVLDQHPNYKILYATSEEFTSELVLAIKNKQTEDFKNKYRNIDMLLIDDIQFIVGRESTQEEFFHTFNTLYESQKQIIISSDKPPKDIENLEDRLISRFKVGLTVDVQPPNYETRMAILRKRAELDNISIDNEALDYIASNIKSNIRELEGALNQIHNFSRLHKVSGIHLDLVEEALKNIISPDGDKPITSETIINIVAEHYNVSVEDIKGQKRSKDIAYPRQVCMYLCRQMTSDSLQSIGAALGKKDHTTIIHGEKKIDAELKKDEILRNTMDILIKKINPSK